MYKRFILSIITILALVSCSQSDVSRSRVSMDFDWKFIQEDIKGAEVTDFDDSKWRSLNVPHDWSIEGNYDKSNPAGKAGGFLPTGIGWYRKVIDINPEEGMRYSIEFDGVYMNSDVWINGHHLGKRPYGYIGFSYDLTPYLRDGENILAVRVDHSKAPSGRWYTGSGIYRHVWLTATSNIYIPQWGTYVTTPKIDSSLANVSLECKINNDTKQSAELEIRSTIISKDGSTVSSAQSTLVVDANTQSKVVQNLEVKDPELWSPDTPTMYSIETNVYENGQCIDSYTTPLGIRSIELRGAKGFYLNGEPIKLKGLSNHHDAGPVGAAVPDDVLYSRLKKLKEMGCNALRTTHNPFAPEFYVMCDTMGFMVMNEAFDGWFTPKAKFDYGLYFEEWWQRDLEDFMHRDRNHPSVIMWSIGNEVPRFTGEQQKLISDYARSIDSSRPVSQGRGYMQPYIDLSGFNGHGEFRGVLEAHHEEFPDRTIVGTEITHTLQTRGIYRTKTWYRTKDNPAPWEKPEDFTEMEPLIYKIPDLTQEEVFTGIPKEYQSSYDNSIVRVGVRDDWNRVENMDYYIGNFRWTGYDYIGESFNWPARTDNFGILDLAGFEKDHFYLYQSLWSDKPMVHILPHWTHHGLEGVEIPVVVYTNCDEAELLLNGKSLGKKRMTDERQIVWLVPYEPGTITVESYDAAGNKISKSYSTADSAATIDIKVDRDKITANQQDVVVCEVTITDKNGVMVPNANNLINFEIDGPAKIIGVENGDILDLSPHKVNYRKAFNGKVLLLVQSTDKSGDIRITATSEGLADGVVNIKSHN